MGLSTSYKTVVRVLNVMREDFDDEVLDWKNVCFMLRWFSNNVVGKLIKPEL
jgi:hypothetical protein